MFISVTFSSRDNDSAFNEKLSEFQSYLVGRGYSEASGGQHGHQVLTQGVVCTGLDVKWSWLLLQGCKALCCGWFLGEKHGEEQMGSVSFKKKCQMHRNLISRVEIFCFVSTFNHRSAKNIVVLVRPSTPGANAERGRGSVLPIIGGYRVLGEADERKMAVGAGGKGLLGGGGCLYMMLNVWKAILTSTYLSREISIVK